MTARGGGPTPSELRNMGPRGVPTYPLGIAERWHRNLQSLAKERNPAFRGLPRFNFGVGRRIGRGLAASAQPTGATRH
jgi:hypothetical protein